MRKLIKKMLCIFTVAVMSMSFIACGSGNNNSGNDKPDDIVIDKDKTQLVVGVYDGGLGREWFREVIKRFEEKYTDIQIVPRYNKDRYQTNTMMANYAGYDEDVFQVDIVENEYYNKKMYYDISDVVSTPLTEFGESRSILDKMSEEARDTYKEADGKYYALPFYEGVYSIIYDIALFENKSFYMDGNGGYSDGSVKSKGKDGIAGTYDDGLPTTVDEFFALCNKMIQSGVIPFTWTGVNGYYTTKMLESFWASYEGFENTTMAYNLNSKGKEYTFADGHSEVVTRENAYKLKNGQKGKLAALEFAYDILYGHNGVNGNGKYHSENVWATGQSHLAAQQEFIFSTATGKPIAFLIDGTWWERESADDFASLYKRTKNPQDKYGVRRFGVMPLPTTHDDGKGQENVMITTQGNRVFINSNTKHPEEAKKFFRFLHTDEVLSMTTSLSNTLRPYDYNVTEADKEKMTPYGKQIVEFAKSENSNAKFVADVCVDEYFKKAGFFGYQAWTFGSTYGPYIMDVFHYKTEVTPTMYFDSLAIDPSLWSAWITAYEEARG